MTVKFFGHPLCYGLPILHHHDAVTGSKNVTEQMGNQDHAGALGHLFSDKAQKLLGCHGIKGGRWFIENDQAQRTVGHRKGPGNFRHLALADGQIGNGVIGVDAMAGENFIKLFTGQIMAALFPARPFQQRSEQCGHFRRP